MPLDDGTEWFQPSNLEITDVEVGNPATNVIPARAKARISIRFNDTHSGAELSRRLTEIAERHGATARPVIYGEPFTTAHAIAFVAIWTALALYVVAMLRSPRLPQAPE